MTNQQDIRQELIQVETADPNQLEAVQIMAQVEYSGDPATAYMHLYRLREQVEWAEADELRLFQLMAQVEYVKPGVAPPPSGGGLFFCHG